MFHGALESTQNWFVHSVDIKDAFHQMRILVWLQAIFALPTGYSGKRSARNDLFPIL